MRIEEMYDCYLIVNEVNNAIGVFINENCFSVFDLRPNMSIKRVTFAQAIEALKRTRE